jgi:hypothetical protein
MELRDWHFRLEKHFKELREDRSTIGPDQPIFGLEHGLGSNELRDLSNTIRTHIISNAPSWDHRLAWIVYATEIGYLYAGDEYWPTFENDTPGWAVNGNHYWLRKCFLWFHEEFGGAKPTGRWAERFSIICWPISHAILPRDLQRQLARILFELRHSFSPDILESPFLLGRLIASRSWNTNSRFQNLAEETALIGQIATALLLQGEFGSAKLLHPGTLLRIGKDLDRERVAREWLRSARRIANERAQIRGLMFGSRPTGPTQLGPENARAEVEALGIEPQLILRPKDSLGTSWAVWLKIPDLSHLLVKFPNLRDILTGSRCIIAGSSGRHVARGGFLHGAQKRELIKWPRSDDVLFQFERTDPELEYLLSTECMLRPGPIWLFRIASDNLAYESRSLRVRPGEHYIIINSIEQIRSPFAQSIEISCEGIHAARIEIPSALTGEWEEVLIGLGLNQSKKIEVWPAGLGAVIWDGEGHGGLASEQPCLAIRSDHSIDALIVSIDESSYPPLELTPIAPGEVIFVQLPSLPIGLHVVRVFSRRQSLGEVEWLGDLDVIMRIRGARPWSPGISPHGPLIVSMDPPSPTLEQLWEGKVELFLQGPSHRQVRCTISLFETSNENPSITRQIPPLSLPVTSHEWNRHFNKHFRESQEVQDGYDTARACKLEFSAEDLGGFSVRCEREFKPVRWAVRHEKQGYIARLLDDSGDATPPTVSRYSFYTPSLEEQLEVAPVYRVPNSGGLYVAIRANLAESIIIPPEGRIRFEDLRFEPLLGKVERTTKTIIHLIRIAKFWGNAHISGNLLSSLRQRTILLGVTRQVFSILGGTDWEKGELLFGEGKNSLIGLKSAIPKKREEVGIAAALTPDIESLASAGCKERVRRLSSLSMRFLSLPLIQSAKIIYGANFVRRHPVSPADNLNWLCELALRLASNLADVETWAGNGLQNGVDRLFEQTTLARAARFLVLSIDNYLSSHTAPGQPYSGWEWE